MRRGEGGKGQGEKKKGKKKTCLSDLKNNRDLFVSYLI